MTRGLDDYVREVRELRAEAERKAEESAAATKRAAAKLAKAGISRRDAAEILRVSFQRVQQLVK